MRVAWHVAREGEPYVRTEALSTGKRRPRWAGWHAVQCISVWVITVGDSFRVSIVSGEKPLELNARNARCGSVIYLHSRALRLPATYFVAVRYCDYTYLTVLPVE